MTTVLTRAQYWAVRHAPLHRYSEELWDDGRGFSCSSNTVAYLVLMGHLRVTGEGRVDRAGERFPDITYNRPRPQTKGVGITKAQWELVATNRWSRLYRGVKGWHDKIGRSVHVGDKVVLACIEKGWLKWSDNNLYVVRTEKPYPKYKR